MSARTLVDCEQGRRLGCRTFCCSLIVRLTDADRARLERPTSERCLAKDADGCCVYLDRSSGRCNEWSRRPEVCASYSCNSDPLLQVALTQEWTDLADLVRLGAKAYIAAETRTLVPEES